MEKYISELNQAQQAPVLQKDGALMIIAGAGSGKTRVLTYRIAHLMQQGVKPYQILALTFTNKAAREMKERIAKIVRNQNAKDLWMGTFHSIFLRILKIEHQLLGYPKNFTIYDQKDSERLITTIIKEMKLDKNVYNASQIQSRISSLKNRVIRPEIYIYDREEYEKDTIANRPRFGEIYKNYTERCHKAGAMDFDDLLLKTEELIRNKEILAKYQQKFQYILVDEYQDTNHLQYSIVKKLSEVHKNICVVGDDAQSIYAFRGADIHNIFNFQKDYPQAKIYRLEQNYRSTKNIVLAANSLIERNKNRLEKNVWTDNQWGNRIKVHRSPNDTEEGKFVASQIISLKNQENLSEGNFAVLYRTNAQSRAIEDALRKRDIPYRIFGGISFYQRKEIKDALAYFRLIINHNDEEALRRIINFPTRGIGDTTYEKLTMVANHYNKSVFEVMYNLDKINEHLKISSGIKNRILEFVNMIRTFQQNNAVFDAFSLAEEVMKKTGLLLEYKKDTTPEGIEKLQNLQELLNGIQDFTNTQNQTQSPATIADYLEEISLATDMDKDIDESNRVSLMTIHLAKGLEFPYVFIVGMEEDLFPSAFSLNSQKEMEEERRLFYVALTRAEKQAFLTYTESRFRFGKHNEAQPSRFIKEITPDFLEFLTPFIKNPNHRYEPLLGQSEGFVNKGNLRMQKPISSRPPAYASPKPADLQRLRLVKPELAKPIGNKEIIKLNIGDWVQHERFGKGQVIELEGYGNDVKANVDFTNIGEKKILLRFSKLKKI